MTENHLDDRRYGRSGVRRPDWRGIGLVLVPVVLDTERVGYGNKGTYGWSGRHLFLDRSRRRPYRHLLYIHAVRTRDPQRFASLFAGHRIDMTFRKWETEYGIRIRRQFACEVNTALMETPTGNDAQVIRKAYHEHGVLVFRRQSLWNVNSSNSTPNWQPRYLRGDPLAPTTKSLSSPTCGAKTNRSRSRE